MAKAAEAGATDKKAKQYAEGDIVVLMHNVTTAKKSRLD
jgi:hypothetical protein